MKDGINPKRIEMKANHQGVIHHELVVADEFINGATLGPLDDTISSRMYRWKIGMVPKPYFWKRWVGSGMCAFLNLFQRNHGFKANIGDHGRAVAEEDRTKRTLEKSGLKGDEL